MKIELDMHTHTLASGHAFSTLQEMAKAGAEKGLKLLGITEHTPGIPGTCDPIYFRNYHVIPRQMYGIELMLGAEINILDGEGNIDADEELMRRLDIRIAGIHSLDPKAPIWRITPGAFPSATARSRSSPALCRRKP